VLAQRYAVERLIGEGTFGWVLSALDVGVSPPRRVALKVLRHRYAAQEDAVRRFERRELAILTRVQASQPTTHVVHALEPMVLKHGTLPYLVLEFIDGPSLREALDGGPFEPTRVRRLGADLARGLAAIHAVGGVHRDLKPTNIRLRGGSEPVIVDLGITRALWETQESTEPGPAPMTPLYASPEQRAGREVGPASDVYSLGLILYEMFTGDVPLAGQEPEKALAIRGGGLASAFRAPGRRIPRELREWVLRCLERDPARRPTALEMAEVLSAPPVSPWRYQVLRWLPGPGMRRLLVLLGAIVLLTPPPPPFQPLPPPPPPPDVDGGPWSMRLGDADQQSTMRIALGARGDLFVAGSFRGSIQLGDKELRSVDSQDVFVARLDPKGQVLWIRQFSGRGWQGAAGIASDLEGNVFVTGAFTGTMDFGGQRIVNAVGLDVFLACLDAEGGLVWIKSFGRVSEKTVFSVGEQMVSGVVVDPEGNAIITGSFHGTMDFGGGEINSVGLSDVFLARFAPDGRLLWSKRFGDAQVQSSNGLAVDREGNIAIMGLFEGSIDFGDGALTSAGMQDGFVALFDAQGDIRWKQRFGGSGNQLSGPGTFDAAGHVIVVESFERTSESSAAFFITRFTPDGHLLWRRPFKGMERPALRNLAASPEGQILITGALQGTADFGDGPFSGLGGMDIILLGLGPDGALLGARRFGDAADQSGHAMAVDSVGNVFLAGPFMGTLDLGSGLMSSAGREDLFIARLAPPFERTRIAESDGCLPPLPGLVAWYPFDKPDPGAGMGSSPPGRLVGKAGPAAGRVRDALRLEGDGFFDANHARAFDFGEGPFSLGVWIRTTELEETSVILDKRSEAPSRGPMVGYHMYLDHGRLGFHLADGSGPGVLCEMKRSTSCTNYRSGYFVADGAWHFVAVTVERGAPSGGTFYVDGVVVARFDPTIRSGSLDNRHPLRIGSRSSSETGLFHGLIDEVTLWNRVLTPSEIASLYRAGGAGLCRPQSSELPRKP
jgi:serine/threonine protein kinase